MKMKEFIDKLCMLEKCPEDVGLIRSSCIEDCKTCWGTATRQLEYYESDATPIEEMQKQIKNINARLGEFEAKRCKLSKTEEEEKVYQWVVLEGNKALQIDNLLTEHQIIDWCTKYTCVTKYAKLVDILQPDGSINISKMKEVKEATQ